MAEAAEPEHAESGQISFEPERFELVADARLEVSGRWFGVRGRRFVRPTLTLTGESGRIRLLADLEHKPWAAQDGEHWMAAFALERRPAGVTEAELAVTPDIAVSLAPPQSLVDGSGSAAEGMRQPSETAVVASRLAPGSAPLPRQSAPPHASRQPANEEVPRDELAAARDRLEQVKTERDAAVNRRDGAVERLDAVLEELAAAKRERDSSVQAREDAVREREDAVRERDEAVRHRDHAERERDEARKGWKDAHQGWREAVRERDRARTERDQAIAAREELTELRKLTEAEAEPIEVMAVRSETTRRGPVRPGPRPRRPTAMGVNWLLRGLAVVVLVAAIIALIIIVQSA